MPKVSIGGDRLGSGNKQDVHIKNYSRSSHDLGYLWRSSMAAGTLVPFMAELALPGDSWDIDLSCEVLTLPTIGPLFGSFKVQLDVFEIPIRLYNGKLHMNMLNIGMDMSQIFLPRVRIRAEHTDDVSATAQVNPSSLFSYLGIKGIGRFTGEPTGDRERFFNAVTYLGYWDIYKQYYADKQQEVGYVIHNDLDNSLEGLAKQVNIIDIVTGVNLGSITAQDITLTSGPLFGMNWVITLPERLWGAKPTVDTGNLFFTTDIITRSVGDAFASIDYQYPNDKQMIMICRDFLFASEGAATVIELSTFDVPFNTDILINLSPQLKEFPLENIDNMRMSILSDVASTTPFTITEGATAPYWFPLFKGTYGYPITSSQEGLGLKTYQSDLFNNWINTEWIDGTNGVNEISAVSTAGDSFTIDALNLASKVYVLMNRIALSGGSYDDWLNAVYTHERAKGTESPIYHGGLIRELGFEEVISNSESIVEGNKQPLGTLAGRGRMAEKNKGGKIVIKVNEPSYIMGIVSITPRIDYSQGNKWDLNLKTLNDLHKPQLDAIGYEDLITDGMAWFDTEIDGSNVLTFKSAGKQPAWINYMTNVNRVFGNFAIEEKEMFMTLNRRYELDPETNIMDVTTYIDPTKYNHIFAETALDAQNFWVQISNQIIARRKMSAKVIPNL